MDIVASFENNNGSVSVCWDDGGVSRHPPVRLSRVPDLRVVFYYKNSWQIEILRAEQATLFA
jgi:hypothetical protein